MELTKEQVLDFLPHRDPFLFIDTIKEIKLNSEKQIKDLEAKDLVNSSVTAQFFISKNMEVLKGHFPGNPIVPGVVQIEMMAQASAFISYPLTLALQGDVKVETLLLAVEKTKFRKILIPDTLVTIEAKMIKIRSGMASYEATIKSDDQEVAQASFLAKIVITKE
jgi:3-hydroxyacyl-[acyl-carrier-protein] dehydratase